MSDNVVPFSKTLSNDLITQAFEGAPVRILMRGGEPWFVLADICRILEIGNPSQVASRLEDDEKYPLIIDEGYTKQWLTGIVLGTMITIVNESGLFNLILTSRKESARRLRKWVTSEVLPSIRKTGSYGVPPPMTQLDALKIALAGWEKEKADKEKAEQALITTQVQLRTEEGKLIEAQDHIGRMAFPALAYNKFMSADGTWTLQNAGRIITGKPNKFIEWLQSEGYIFRQGGKLVPMARYNNKLFVTKLVTQTNDVEKLVIQTFVAKAGLERFMFLREGGAKGLKFEAANIDD